MITQELIEYIKTQLQTGLSPNVIRSNLVKNGWQSSDIESAFQVIPSNPPVKRFSLTFIIILISGLTLTAGGIFAANSFIKNKTPSRPPLASSTPLAPSASPVIDQNNSETSILYSNPQQGYGFRYFQSWKIDQQGTLTVLANPDNPKFQQCAATLEKTLACDVMISTLPYTGTKTNIEQVKEIATQLAIGNSIAPITINNLSGYNAPSTTPEGSTYNVLLQGSKNMILVQFPYKKTKPDLNPGQLTILNSISEQ